MSFNNAVSNEPKLLTMQHSNSYHKWARHGEECLRKMAKLKYFKLMGNMDPCDTCSTVKAKANHISNISNPRKRVIEVGDLVRC